jgi:uncharacterized protein YkwD
MFYFTLLLALCLLSPVISARSASDENGKIKTNKNRQLLDLLNQKRHQKCLAPLAWNEGLVTVAANYNESLKKSGKFIQQTSKIRDAELLKKVSQYRIPLLFVNGFTAQNIKDPEVMIDAIMQNDLWKKMCMDAEANAFGASLNGCYWTVDLGMLKDFKLKSFQEPRVKGVSR